MVVHDLPRQLTAGADVVARCRELARVSEEADRLVRPFASPAMARANALVGGWMRAAGLDVRIDAAGNLVGHRSGRDPAAGTLLLGSHLDTVADAGAFDGPLGVLAAIAVVERLGTLPFAVDVYGFSDEEGLRFGTAYLGSRAVAGTLPEPVLALRDAHGVSVAEALEEYRERPVDVAAASRAGERILGWCEVHIEQGPVLEDRGAPVGVVSAIAGATRAAVGFRGRPGHAGTVPMAGRRDAGVAAAAFVLAVEEVGRSVDGLVATVGRIEALPGAPNVVPGAAVCSLDVRHADDDVRRTAVEAVRSRALAIGAARGIEVTWDVRLDTAAVATDACLTARLAAAAGDPVPSLASGAGHDGVALATLCPIAMLFVRCEGGLSHHPDEAVAAEDVDVALDVLEQFVRSFA